MFCSSCGKEVLSDTKFCPQCGKAISASTKPANASCIVVMLAIFVVFLQIFLLEGLSKTGRDLTGFYVGFGLMYFSLFILFLATLFRKKTAPEPKETAATPKAKEEKKAPSHAWKWIIGLIVLFFLFPFFGILGKVGAISPAMSTAVVVVFLLLAVILSVRFYKKNRESFVRIWRNIGSAIAFVRHHILLTGFSALACIAIVLVIYALFVQAGYSDMEQALPRIQDNMAEVATAKLMGDSIVAGYGVPGMWMGKIADIAKTTSTNLKQISMPLALASYKESALLWSGAVAGAAAGSTYWKDLSESPPVFSLRLNDAKVNEFIEASLQKVAELRVAGDLALARKDRQTMYYIAGQLLVQEAWLDGIMHSTDPGALSLSSQVYAWFPGPVTRSWSCTSRTVAARCGNGSPVDLVKAVRQAAVSYAAAKAGADEQWNKVTADLLKVPTDQGKYTETQGGVYNGEPNLPPQLSVHEKVFVDACKAKGGTTGGTGGVYARMPTTESGIACHYGEGNGCWDYLTRSGRNYSGGNPGCHEENLLPPPPTPTPTARPTPPPQSPERPQNPPPTSAPPAASWDGTYNLQMSGSCSVQNYGYSGVSIDRITVRNNRVTNNMGQSAPIDSAGHARISSSVSGMGYTQTFSFSGNHVQGSFDIPALRGVCSLTFSGNR